MMSEITVHMTVNGKAYAHDVEPRLLLVYYLRDILRLTGTHIGCDTSSCGACNVLIDGKTAKACTILACQADGTEITTVEGLSKNGDLHPLQEAFKEHHGLQCGYCTPGILITAAGLLQQHAEPSESEIRDSLEGNFCRCTGYHNIIKSIQHAASIMRQKEVKS